MSSPSPARLPRVNSLRRISLFPQQDEPPTLFATHGSGALVSLLQRTRSTMSLASQHRSSVAIPHGGGGGDAADDDEGGPLSMPPGGERGGGAVFRFGGDWEEDEPRRLAADERRLSQLILGPQMRSMRLIGNSNPRYQWERYWKTEAELEEMSPPLRQYYERTNHLVQMYLYIDRLLDSPVPHDMLNEYSAELEASAYPVRPLDVPPSISEEPATPSSPLAYGACSSTEGGNAVSSPITDSNNASTTSMTKKVKRRPKDIFRSSETMPLLDGREGGPAADEDPETGTVSPRDGPRPAIPWLEDAELDSDDPIVTIAIWVNFAANAILLAAKIVVVVWVPSMSVLASLVDAVLDFLSTAIVFATTTLIAASERDQFHYPVGRRRLEPLGVLVFSIVMITSFAQVALECIQRLLSTDHQIIELGVSAISIMLGTVIIKGAVWLWCRLVKNSSVRALADDAKTDIIFNTGSILFPIVGFYARIWWLDALGGLLLSLVVIINWSQTSLHHVRNLTGFSALPDERNLLLYLTMRFATSIRQIQNLRAYHAGDKLFVEVDIVLSANTPLKDSHDLSEVLTYFLESVPIVDRAFVHVDYLTYNVPTHIVQNNRDD